MPTTPPQSAKRGRTLVVVTFAVLIAVFFAWAAIETAIRANPAGLVVLEFLERPILELGDLSLSLEFLIKAGVFLVVLGLIAGRVRQFTREILARGSNLEHGQRYAIEKAVGYAVIVFGTIVGLQSAGINLSSLAVVGGALGIGIGLGFQEATNNFLSGIILLVERPIKVGDRVEVGNLNGDVVRIGSRATWVRTNANITVIVPNSEFVMRQVINWTATDRQVRFDVPVGVTYKADPEEVRDVLIAIAIEDPDVLERPEPDVLFKGFGDSSLDFELRVWTQTQVRTPNVLRSRLYFAIFKEFGRRGIEIPYPQRDLHLRSSEARIQIDPAS